MPSIQASQPIDNRVAVAFSRVVTRRTLLRRGMIVAAGSAAAVAGFPRRAFGWGGVGGPGRCTFHVNTWGCHCASTPSCGKRHCCDTSGNLFVYDKCCGSADPRCNYWGQSPHCWCSRTCCLNGTKGYFSCCDCWKYGNSGGSCRHGSVKCICKGHVNLGNC
jgi:hypothetical protein